MSASASPLSQSKIIGIIGGGQLGRMASLAAARLGYKCHIFCDVPNSPAFQVCHTHTLASYNDIQALKAFADSVDVVTFEFENIPFESVKVLESMVDVRPGWHVLRISQDRLIEKTTISKAGIETAPFCAVSSLSDLESAVDKIGRPSVLKTARFGYDGKGQVMIKEETDLAQAYKAMNGAEAILEGFINFERELSVIVARSANGEIKAFEAVENIHVDHILDTTRAPANISDMVRDRANAIALKLAEELDVVGLLAVEMFHTRDDKLLVNEIAPRTHNSGHWSMDGCLTDQFEQQIRAITGLPLGSTERTHDTLMKNLIGDAVNGSIDYLAQKNAKLHLYGKNEIKSGRKMGHVNFIYPLGQLPQ